MQRALELAKYGHGRTSPNPMVGAVIVKGGRIIAEGWHKRCGGDHAEVNALRKIGSRAQGATLYVTLEPCSHWGRTPPCTEAIIKAGVKKVVVGVLDPNPRIHGKSVHLLRKAGIKVEVGFLQEKLWSMNEVFNKYITKRMPFVVAKCAQTIDGKIATATGQSKWITSPKSREHAHRKRNEFDAMMVGINTVLQDDPQLNPTRKNKRLKKIVVDSSLRIPLKARLLHTTNPSDVIVATTARASEKKIQQLTNKGVQVWVAPARGEHSHVDLKWLFKELAKNEMAYVLIEGGGRLIGRALKDRLVDRMMIYVAPKIIGDQNALSAMAGLNVQNINQALELKNVRVQKIGDDFLIEGYLT
ncbi:MAG: bifunctional diaminohydroxyphosphoribosylaminopyrimidine deaminase/5-amino-6-(5-phosphoribosylamino)uracil reductase RibD [Candidatus Omnitrophica bacterium]|nr:bifunctional diaminohydroxyphosphoribosylaminopyrimidine deaminase/5-amino-6-(5-phosphoribosylamino)uracil reductase RibD [Candidatus Omnitrophota bacterium]